MAMTGKRILIVEDHPKSADALKGMIERRGGSAEAVESVEEAKALIRLRDARGPKIDLIVSDLGLPDSHAEETLVWLASLAARGFTVCAMSGLEDPGIVERAAKENVCMILKGTPAEGIIESILYSLMRADPAFASVAAKEIVDNRQMVREIPVHMKAWAFLNWPKWVQVCSGVTAILLMFGTVVTGASAILHTLDVRSVANEAGRQAATANRAIMDTNTGRLNKIDGELRSLEDDRIKILEHLTAIEQGLAKLEAKLDLRDERTNAMWQQRQDGRTNQQLIDAGTQGLPALESPRPLYSPPPK